MSDKEMRQKDLDWENRVLCSDESCIGVIGPDGRCRECGRPYEGTLPEGFESSAGRDDTIDESQEAAEDIAASDTDDASEPENASDADDEWARRKLCSDESCIGVIGPDGRCKECGLRYEG